MASVYKQLSDLTTERLEMDFTEEINKLDAKINPLTVLTNQIKSRGTTNSVYHYWYQEELDNRWDTVNTADTGASYITVYNSGRFHKWDVLYIPEEGSILIATGAPSAGKSIAVTEIATGTANSDDGDNILVLGPSIEEGSGGVDAYQGDLTPRSNYTVTLQRTFGVTREQQVNAMHGGNELARLTNKKGREHARDIELHLWWGVRDLDATGPVTGDAAYAHRWMGGLQYFLTGGGDGNCTNTNADGALTEAELQGWLYDCFKYTDTLYLFCGEYGLQCFDNWARGKLKMVPSDRSYGLNITEYPLSGRMAYIVDASRILEAGPQSGGTDFSDEIWALDLADIKFLWYTGGGTKLTTNVQNPKAGVNRREDLYQSQFTLEVGNAKRHGRMYGITGVG